MKNEEKWSYGTTAIVAALIGLSAVVTLTIRIPIPATTGYFNIGDVFIVLAGLWLGPLAGLVVGGIGPAIADAIGFPQFILATAITKGCEGFIVGLIARNAKSLFRPTIAAIVGGIVVVVGYFVFEAYIYPFLAKFIPFFGVTDFGAAITELGPNAFQGLVGAVGGLAIWKGIAGLATETGSQDQFTTKPPKN
jgi:uncharacterized membrane protein